MDAGHCLHAVWKHQLGTGPGNVKEVEYPMTIHTLVFSLSPDMTVQDRQKFFAEMGSVMLNGGGQKSEHRPHLPLPADDHAPVFKATDVVLIWRERGGQARRHRAVTGTRGLGWGIGGRRGSRVAARQWYR